MSFASPTPRQAAIELVFVAGFWGFGFVATQWALNTWSPLGVLLLRFSGALVLGEALHWMFRMSRPRVPRDLLKEKKMWSRDLFLALPAGVLLGSFLLMQTIGLLDTTATKSGFITTLYVVFVPFLNMLLFRKKQPLQIIVLGMVASVGMFFLMDMHLATLTADMNVGDLWTLASAVLAAGHIIYIGRIVDKVKDPFRLNNYQSLWAMLTIAPTVFFSSDLQHSPIESRAVIGLVVLAAACSVLAFFVQVRSQKVLADTTASMLFLLESPYAFFFAYLLMGDRLDGLQALGALLILGAALLTVVLEPSASTSKTPLE
jgi:drug/metabolite transporter (DMT)-like permease